MVSSFNKDNIFNILDTIDENLKKRTLLTVIGSTVCVLLEHPDKETTSMDVLLPFSRIDRDFETVCQKASVSLNSKDKNIASIKLISLNDVDIGKFKEKDCIDVYKSDKLRVRVVPPENIIASKLIDISEKDLSDCVFLIRKFRLGKDRIKQAIMTLKNKKIAMKNFVLLENSKAFDKEPFKQIRNRVKKKLLRLKSAEGLRDRYVEVVSFLLSGKSPSELLINEKFDTYRDLIEYMREGQPDFTLALHDPEMYKKLRNRVTDLICQGWI